MARSILAVVVGYLIFALSAFAFFQISGQPPHQAAPMPIKLGSIVFGMVFALIGGTLPHGWLDVGLWLMVLLSRRCWHSVPQSHCSVLSARVQFCRKLQRSCSWRRALSLVAGCVPGR